MTIEHAREITSAGIAWRAIVVGFGYLVLLAIGGSLLVFLGADLPAAEDASEQLPWILISGVAIGLILGPLNKNLAASRGQKFLVWVSLLFLNSLGVAIEGYFFVPGIISPATFPYLIAQQLIAAAGTAALISILFTPKPNSDAATEFSKRSWYSWLWRLAVGVLIYVFLFLVIGRLNFELVTRPFYEQQGGLDLPDMPSLLAVETIRGILIVFSVLPLILLFQTTKRRLMISTGIIVFLIGGLVPLMLQVTTLPGFLLMASGWEIFLQLFPTGMAAAALLAE